MKVPPIPLELAHDVPLAPFTTIRVGGTARACATARSFREVTEALAWAASRALPVAVIGKGSNLLISDEGFSGLALRLSGRLSTIVVRDRQLWCGGGASLPRAVQRAAKHGLAGLEFGASIPGSVGGAVAMNAGAYRSELKDVLCWAVVCTADGRRRVGPGDLEMGYRHTGLRGGEVVAAAAFDLRPDDTEAILARLGEFRGQRRATQPQGVRTFGSVFANPPGDSSGRLLESVDCKGLAIGGARFSPVHANFIEAGPDCRAEDVLALMREGRKRVAAVGGPVLESEVRFLDPVKGITRPPLGEVD